MISNKEVKLITSLSQKKYRNKHKLFIAEGIKLVHELIRAGFDSEYIFSTQILDSIPKKNLRIISEVELKKISNLKTPNSILGVFKIPVFKKNTESSLQIVLDSIQDPGNLGTIIRLCDWFGISNLFCSKDTVDCFNPKVVQASMGSIARVRVYYEDIETFVKESPLPKYSTLLRGKNIYRQELPNKALIVMGNEANGIRKEIQELIQNPISIPQFGEIQETESLNVAMATAIVLSEFRRKIQ